MTELKVLQGNVLDAKADGKAGVLTVFAIHQDTPFELRFAAARGLAGLSGLCRRRLCS